MSKSVWDQQTNRGICCRPDCNASVTSVCREGTCCPLITLKLTSVTLYYPTPLWMKDTTCGLSLVLYINTELFDWFSMRWNWTDQTGSPEVCPFENLIENFPWWGPGADDVWSSAGNFHLRDLIGVRCEVTIQSLILIAITRLSQGSKWWR